MDPAVRTPTAPAPVGQGRDPGPRGAPPEPRGVVPHGKGKDEPGVIGAAIRRITRSFATTPGRLTIVAVGLVALSVLTGLTAALSFQQKTNTIDDLAGHREPLSAAAQDIYRSLSDADATAASAFLSGGVEPPELRSRYEVDIARAGAALAKASSDVGDIPAAGQQVDVLSKQLPVYAGLVETARANNRQGFPAGAAYLREASGLMRSQLLPAAQELYRIDVERLTEEQDEATSFPWLTTLLVLGLLAALVVTQRYLTRKTNRVLNVGLLAATAAVGLGLIWGTVALLITSSRVGEGRVSGSQQVDVLVQARIVALKCRANETLTLVARGDGPGYEKEFKEICGAISGRGGDGDLLTRARGLAAEAEASEVGRAVDAAIRDAQAWLTKHDEIRRLDDSGDYEAAVKLATDTTPEGAATAFAQLDTDLVNAITAGRKTFFTETTSGSQALTGLVPGVVVLALVAAAGATTGIRQRLQEYR